MTVPYFTLDQLLAYVKSYGYTVCNNDYWNDFDRIIVENEEHNFPIQIQDVYFCHSVCKMCERIGIPPPEDHKRVVEQIKNQYRKGRSSN